MQYFYCGTEKDEEIRKKNIYILHSTNACKLRFNLKIKNYLENKKIFSLIFLMCVFS